MGPRAALVAALAVSLCVALARAAPDGFHPMERLIPRTDFIRKERSDPNHVHQLVFSIRKNNMDELKKVALERSTPGHPQFREWLSCDAVDTMVMNLPGYDRVAAWLATQPSVSVQKVTRRKDYIIVDATIGVWEKLLHTQFHQFEDLTRPAQARIVHRALEYSIPAELKQDISAVFNTVHTPPVFSERHHRAVGAPFKSDMRLRRRESAQATGEVTVDFLNSYYQINSNIGSAALNQSVFETNTEYFSPTDLTDFQKDYDLTVQGALSIGGHTTTNCNANNVDCYEGNLDVQYIMGVAQVTSTVYWFVADTANTDPFVTYVTDVADMANPPQANSISWGSIETVQQASTLDAFDDEASILAARGVTVTVSTGDNGAPGTYNNQCLCNYDSSSDQTPWTGGTTWTGTGYFPSFPATSPWVTAVGATQGPESGDAEIACQSQEGGVITTGGGFSTYYATPSWQTSTTQAYFGSLTAATTPAAGYNPNGRGYPDISLIGVNYQVVVQGVTEGLYGTSASAPVLAAFVSLVNAARIANNQSTIGFLNPTLYAVGLNNTLSLGNVYNASFNDVTSGNNKCCASSNPSAATCCVSGFTSVDGWDPVTGWGSVFFPDFAAIFDVAAPYTPTDDDDGDDDGLSPAAVAGVVVGVLVVVGLVGAVVWWAVYSCCSAGSAAPAASAGNYAMSASPPAPTITLVQAQPLTHGDIFVSVNPIGGKY